MSRKIDSNYLRNKKHRLKYKRENLNKLNNLLFAIVFPL